MQLLQTQTQNEKANAKKKKNPCCDKNDKRQI